MDENLAKKKENLLRKLDEMEKDLTQEIKKLDNLEKDVSNFIDILYENYINFFDVNYNPQYLTEENNKNSTTLD